ncbi:hypothetical protein KSZ_24170 [Dictyobacter formicarum]|uniref:Uncharacterized protein n=1 Tax=Dictyobacter formicarum TaxID=2778368 RepID=A0ABQ3VFD0_9CHLR|nr:hypothetical protein KSZ_24170 [Dictyobacter formicarum]
MRGYLQRLLQGHYDLFMQAPASVVILRGPIYEIELANPITRKLWGKIDEAHTTLLRSSKPF